MIKKGMISSTIIKCLTKKELRNFIQLEVFKRCKIVSGFYNRNKKEVKIKMLWNKEAINSLTKIKNLINTEYLETYKLINNFETYKILLTEFVYMHNADIEAKLDVEESESDTTASSSTEEEEDVADTSLQTSHADENTITTPTPPLQTSQVVTLDDVNVMKMPKDNKIILDDAKILHAIKLLKKKLKRLIKMYKRVLKSIKKSKEELKTMKEKKKNINNRIIKLNERIEGIIMDAPYYTMKSFSELTEFVIPTLHAMHV